MIISYFFATKTRWSLRMVRKPASESESERNSLNTSNTLD